LTKSKKTGKPVFRFQPQQEASVNLIADERYNPLKSRTKEGCIK